MVCLFTLVYLINQSKFIDLKKEKNTELLDIQNYTRANAFSIQIVKNKIQYCLPSRLTLTNTLVQLQPN